MAVSACLLCWHRQAKHALPGRLGRIKLRYAKSLPGRATPHQSSRPDVLFLSSRGGRCRRALPVFVPWNYALARAGNSARALMSVASPLDRLGPSPPSPERKVFRATPRQWFPLKAYLYASLFDASLKLCEFALCFARLTARTGRAGLRRHFIALPNLSGRS